MSSHFSYYNLSRAAHELQPQQRPAASSMPMDFNIGLDRDLRFRQFMPCVLNLPRWPWFVLMVTPKLSTAALLRNSLFYCSLRPCLLDSLSLMLHITHQMNFLRYLRCCFFALLQVVLWASFFSSGSSIDCSAPSFRKRQIQR